MTSFRGKTGNYRTLSRHSREGGNPGCRVSEKFFWIPAFAGMTNLELIGTFLALFSAAAKAA